MGLLCDGQLLQISEFPALFDLIGTTYGGDGVTTFALPDLQGRDIIGAGDGFTLGEQVGAPRMQLWPTPIRRWPRMRRSPPSSPAVMDSC